MPRSPEVRIHVLLTHPYFWPYVTRGAEREVHGVGSRLSARGHRVDLLTGRPHGLIGHRRVDGIHVREVRSALPSAVARRGINREAAFALPATLAGTLSRADVVLSFYYSDVVGATLLRRNRPTILKLTGAVLRDRVRDNRVERELIQRALDRAEQVWVNSRYVADVMSAWGRAMDVVPAGVDVEVFRPRRPRADEPLVVCTAASGEPRKRLVDLVDAWPAVLDAVPDARLLLVQRHDDEVRRALTERLPEHARSSVTFAGPYDDDQLADLYSRAWVTVAPAAYEALGLATLESLACGTPVAGADSGATTELVGSGDVGRLFPIGDPGGCAEAVVALLQQDEQPERREARRAVAMRYAWPAIVDDIERRLASAVQRA